MAVHRPTRSLMAFVAFLVLSGLLSLACRATATSPQDQIVAPHFIDSSPGHGQVFRQPPEDIVINFNFTLHERSSIKATREAMTVALGTTRIEANKLTMRAALGASAGEGDYLVSYTACWPDGSCHDGRFGFKVDSKLAGYLDMTGRKEVSISMKDLKFNPANIVISRGTNVTWVNDEGVAHFVNTDPHPSHNVLLGLNSLDLNQGQNYSFVFTEPGEWPYHCSAHYPAGMMGRIIVAAN